MNAGAQQRREQLADRFVKWSSFVVAPGMLGFAAVQYYGYGVVGSALACLVAAGMVLFTPLVPRIGIRMDAYMSTIGYLTITAFSYFRGGVLIPVLGWSICIPIAALMLGRRQGAVIWAVMVVLQFIGLYAAQRLGLLPDYVPATPAGSLSGMTAMILFLATITIVMDRLRLRAERESDRLRSQLFQANKLEGIARLASGVAHEFNNLLAVIASRASVMRSELGADDEHQLDIEAIERATRSGATLTRRLLAIGRADLSAKVVALDLNRLVTDTGKMLASVLPDNVRLRIERDARPVVVEIDREQMLQVLMNLAINARDAMPDGGELTITTQRRVLSTPRQTRHGEIPAGRYAALAIDDCGQGMADELLDKIFDPFFTTKGVDLGSGLGLPVVYGVVIGGGGHLEVVSEESYGTTFTVYLPLSDASPSPLSVRPPPAQQGDKHVTVLLVEDDAAVRKATLRLLKRQGHTVITADSGERALALSDEHEGALEVLLTDMVMTGMSGRELAAEIRARRPSIGVVYMSGYPGDMLEGVDLEADGAVFLQKPASPEQLNGAIVSVSATLEG